MAVIMIAALGDVANDAAVQELHLSTHQHKHNLNLCYTEIVYQGCNTGAADVARNSVYDPMAATRGILLMLHQLQTRGQPISRVPHDFEYMLATCIEARCWHTKANRKTGQQMPKKAPPGNHDGRLPAKTKTEQHRGLPPEAALGRAAGRAAASWLHAPAAAATLHTPPCCLHHL